MRRNVIAMLGVLLLLIVGAIPAGALQDATPPPGGFEIAPGVMAELLPASEDPPSLYRLHFAAGVSYAFSEDPSLAVVYVEAGAATLQVDLPVTVFQAGTTDAEGETFAAGTEFNVTAGDYFVLPPFAAGEVRNQGDETTTVSVAGIVPEEMATPAA